MCYLSIDLISQEVTIDGYQETQVNHFENLYKFHRGRYKS